MRVWAVAGALVLAAGVAGCERKPAETAIPRKRFVLANVALRSVADTVDKGDSLRAAALRKYGVTERDLLRFVRVHAGRPEYMSTVWREISDSLQKRFDRENNIARPTGGDSLPPGMSAPDRNAGRQDEPRGAPPPRTQPPPQTIVRPSGEPVPVPPPPVVHAPGEAVRRPRELKPPRRPTQPVRTPRMPPARTGQGQAIPPPVEAPRPATP